MKYKVGDKVKIKTWDQMGKEFGIHGARTILCEQCFTKHMEEDLNRLNSDRILIIIDIIDNVDQYYNMDNMMYWAWSEDMIECLAKNYKKEIIEPILTRFEIMDL